MTKRKRNLCLWFPSWPLQRVVVDRPPLRGQAVVLYANQTRQGQRVVCCSAAAYEMGIRMGMPLAEVSSLPRQQTAMVADRSTIKSLDREAIHNNSPELVLLEHDPVADLARLELLAATSQRYSPVVGLEQDLPASCLLMEISGSAVRLGGETTLIQTLAEDLHHQGYVPRIAVADTVGAAWAIAHYAELKPLYARQLVIGKALCLPARHGMEWLSELPIESLRLDARTLDTLHALGILRVGQLWQLPRAGIAARFHSQLLSRMDQITGKTPEPIVVFRAPLPLQVSYHFEQPTPHLATIEQISRQLLDQLAERLSQRGEGALQLECHFTLAGAVASESTIRVGFYQPTAMTQHLFDLLRMSLQNHRFAAAIQHITIHVICSAPLLRQQPGLLPDSCQALPAQLRNLIERLSSRLGASAIVSPQLYAEVLPEDAYRYLALTNPGAGNQLQMKRKSRPASAAARQVHSAGLRPLRLYNPPKRIQVVTDATRPVSFQFDGTNFGVQVRVTQAWGPERMETGWWRGPTLRRDYFRVEDETGGRFWIFCDLTNQHWFLHGVFT